MCINSYRTCQQLPNHCTHKDVAWHWQHEQEVAFQMLKKKLKAAPVRSYYNVRKPITLQVDACQSGLGAVLLQEHKPVGMASRAFDGAQIKICGDRDRNAGHLLWVPSIP